ncbi:MAG: YaaA family protein [Acholeplasma sp.]|nr:YaaA family protein [Acholeplasma sp.]
MVILISPSKTFSKTNILGTTSLLFKDKQSEILTKLKQLSKDEIKNIFKLSDSLTNEVYDYYQNSINNLAAIYLYEGILYKALNPVELDFSNHDLYIISALHGLVRPFDAISKYRLDFQTTSLGNLYHYWENDINNYFSLNHQNELIIDLTSTEFSRLINKLPNVVRIEFISDKRLSSVLLKQMRGYFANHIIKNNIQTLEEIKKIVINSFTYNDQESTDSIFVFDNN